MDDGRRALEAARTESPDLVIVASNLPTTSAFALAAALRSNMRTATVPILFMVPAQDTTALAEAISIDADGVITKPLTRAVLMDAVASRLKGVKASLVDTQSGAAGLASIAEAVDAQSRLPGSASGLLLEAKDATVLVVVLRNLVSLARSLQGRPLDTVLQRFVSEARDTVINHGGWVVRVDATGISALFEHSPNSERSHAARALEASLGVILAARRVKQWAEAAFSDINAPYLSVGCGIHSGEVVIARLSVSGQLTPSIAGQTVEIATRLNGRAKSLGWSVAMTESAAFLAGSRFLFGRRASVNDSDHAVTIPIVEVVGFNPGTARPGELPHMAEVREAMLANTVMARLAGDIDPRLADKTVVFNINKRGVPGEMVPEIPRRRIQRRLGQGAYVTTYLTTHVPSEREEIVKTVPLADTPPEFVERYLEDYRQISGLEQRNVLTVFEVGQVPQVAYVAAEYLSHGSLSDALRKRVPIGLALNHLAQMCLALDAVHGIGLFHGTLRSEHFLMRDERVVVMADFNVTQRIQSALEARNAQLGNGALMSGVDFDDGRRADFKSLGLIFHALLSGEANHESELANLKTEELIGRSRLPISLSPLQPCLDGLLGLGSPRAFERAEEVLVELLALKEIFPFDSRPQDSERASGFR